jgi:hypothetical protein
MERPTDGQQIVKAMILTSPEGLRLKQIEKELKHITVDFEDFSAFILFCR